MDEHGYFNLSCCTGIAKGILETADIVILEVNEHLPKVYGGFDESIHISEVDMVVEGEHARQELEAPVVRQPRERLAGLGDEQADTYISNIDTAARIPGVCILLSEKAENATPENFRKNLSDLIAEDVAIVTTTEDRSRYVSDILGGIVAQEDIECDNESGTVLIKTDKEDIKLLNRLRLLEQFMPYKIGG